MNKDKQLVHKAMRNIYYDGIAKRYDWMGFLITEDNKPTYHHIVKREELIERGESYIATVENGAYLGKRSHELLHQIEQLDHDLYECWNDLFLMINRMKTYPIEHVWSMIFRLQELSLQTIKDNKNGKSHTK